MIISFLVFVFALFLVLGAYLLATHGTDQKRARLQKRLSEALLHSAHTEDIDVVLARNELMSEIPWMNQMLINIQATFHLKRMLDQADLHITPSRLLMFSFMAGMLGGIGGVGADGFHSAHDPGGLGLCFDPVPARLVQTQEALRYVSGTASRCARSWLAERSARATRFLKRCTWFRSKCRNRSRLSFARLTKNRTSVCQ